MRVPAVDITDQLVGRTLTEFSHLGEDPHDDSRRFDQLAHLGGPQPITGIRTSDDDNTVAVLLGWILIDRSDAEHQIGLGDDGWIEVVD